MDFLRPYLLLACVAFTIGFVGYWAMGRLIAPPAAAGEAGQEPMSIPASGPDAWNPPKQI